jgi:hypothetical protein
MIFGFKRHIESLDDFDICGNIKLPLDESGNINFKYHTKCRDLWILVIFIILSIGGLVFLVYFGRNSDIRRVYLPLSSYGEICGLKFAEFDSTLKPDLYVSQNNVLLSWCVGACPSIEKRFI